MTKFGTIGTSSRNSLNTQAQMHKSTAILINTDFRVQKSLYMQKSTTTLGDGDAFKSD